jgi:hypothetical protein
MVREYEDFLKNARADLMADPEAVRLMRATHIKERADFKGAGGEAGTPCG